MQYRHQVVNAEATGNGGFRTAARARVHAEAQTDIKSSSPMILHCIARYYVYNHVEKVVLVGTTFADRQFSLSYL